MGPAQPSGYAYADRGEEVENRDTEQSHRQMRVAIRTENSDRSRDTVNKKSMVRREKTA